MKLLTWIKSLVQSTAAIDVVATSNKEPEPVALEAKVMEHQFFLKENNLVQQFAFDPIPIYSSNFSNPVPIGWQLADGSMVKFKPVEGVININPDKKLVEEYGEYRLVAEDAEEMMFLKLNVDYGHTHGLQTIQQYNDELSNINMNKDESEEELLADDVALLENKTMPQLPESKNIDYAVGNS